MPRVMWNVRNPAVRSIPPTTGLGRVRPIAFSTPVTPRVEFNIAHDPRGGNPNVELPHGNREIPHRIEWSVYPPHVRCNLLILLTIMPAQFVDAPTEAPTKGWLSGQFGKL
jgi:hypothetical protein